MAGAALIAAASAVGTSQMPIDDLPLLLDQPGLEAGQPQEELTPDSLVILLSDDYRALKLEQNDDTPEEKLYSDALGLNNRLTELLPRLDGDKQLSERVKGMIRDINDLLGQGAFYFSRTGNQSALTEYASAYIDAQELPQFAGTQWRRNSAFPTMVYIAASGAFNKRDFPKAISYFDLYIATGTDQRLQQIYNFLGQACLADGQYDKAVTAMTEAMRKFPEDNNFPMIGLQACIDGGRGDAMQSFLDRAFMFAPHDEKLLNLQAQLCEDEQDYQRALDIYDELDRMRPNNMQITRHIALCYYNLGVNHFNRSVMEQDAKAAKREHRQAMTFFEGAQEKLNEVVANDPMALKYLMALATTYGCLNNKEKFDEVNNRILALGAQPQTSMAMPSQVGYSETAATNFGRKGGSESVGAVPTYSEFAKPFVEERLANWAEKGEFEKIEDYRKRVSETSIAEEHERLCREAEKQYLAKYASRLLISDLRLAPYDAANEAYLIESDYGPIVLNVPLKNNEAEAFKAGWSGIRFHNARYYIKDDHVAIATLSFLTPAGKTYTYHSDAEKTYTYTPVSVDINGIVNSRMTAQAGKGGSKTQFNQAVRVGRKSDVDENIPATGKRADNKLAVIIANENYERVASVQSAINDGETFAQYCSRTLGIPENNIRIYKDATYAHMLGAMRDLKSTVKAFGPTAEVIFYYAGHGMPDEQTKDAFLLPRDGDAMLSETCYPLSRLYSELGSMEANSVCVFLDACFSGTMRSSGGEMLRDARGVAIKTNASAPKGNMFALTAASAGETALPYEEKNHGLFTYYLLKHLQDTKGNTTLRQLADYVKDNVSRQSNLINKKPQTPTVTTSGTMTEEQHRRKLRP